MPLRDGSQRLVLLSAWNDSGGGLTARLLDNHPDIAAWPFELQLGTGLRHDAFSDRFYGKYRWPVFPNTMGNSAALFDAIIDDELKSVLSKKQTGKFDGFDIGVDFAVWREQFENTLDGIKPNRRQIVSTYIDTFLAQWRETSKNCKYVSGHCPNIVLDAEDIFADFPDAKIIHLIRDPLAGLGSFRKRHPNMSVVEYADRWNSVNVAAITQQTARPSAVAILQYESLVRERNAAMHFVCQRLDIPFDATLLAPTWNGRILSESDMGPFGGIQTIGHAYDEELRRTITSEEADYLREATIWVQDAIRNNASVGHR